MRRITLALLLAPLGFLNVDAALAASVFHSGAVAIGELKRELKAQGIEVRHDG